MYNFFLKHNIRMSGKSINFDDKMITKSNFYKIKTLFKIDDFVVNKTLISKREPLVKKNSFKYFIAHDDNDDIGPLGIKLPQIIGYVKSFDSNKIILFKVIDEKLLKKYTEIWERISSLMNIEFDSEPLYGDNDKYINT